MGWRNIVQQSIEGLAGAAGADDVVARIEKDKAHGKAWDDFHRQTAIQQNQAAGLNIAQILRTGIHPDTGQPLTPDETSQLMMRSKELQAQNADLWNPHSPINKQGPNLAAVPQLSPIIPQQTTAKTGGLTVSNIGLGGERLPPTVVPGKDLTVNGPGTQQSETMVNTMASGLISPGNIPIWTRPTVQNGDGSHSTEYSTSFTDDQGREVLVPTVVNGKFLTPDGKKPLEGSPEERAMFQRAWQNYEKTHQHLGIFKDAASADNYAGTLHNRGNGPRFTPKTSAQRVADLQGIVQQYQPMPGQMEARSAAMVDEAKKRSELRLIENSNMSEEDKSLARLHVIGGVTRKPVSEMWKPMDVKLADGSSLTVQRNERDGSYTYLDGSAIPSEILSKMKSVPKPVAKKGVIFDKTTGQVWDKDTGTRYNENDPANPPEVNAMFSGASSVQQKTRDFQVKLAAMRGASYNGSKPLAVFDSENGNAPMYVTFGQMQGAPGRFIPVGPGAKAIASENLMQDIAGTSKLTRKAIANLSEDFPTDMKTKIALAMRADDPHAMLDQLIASGSLGSLTPDQQDFLIATRQLTENAMAMRTILGAGQGSEDLRRAITATLPSLLSPDKSFANRQLDAFDQTIARLHRGVPKVKLNDTAAGGSIPKTKVSLAKAMALPQNKGVPEAIVRDAIQKQGHEVIP